VDNYFLFFKLVDLILNQKKKRYTSKLYLLLSKKLLASEGIWYAQFSYTNLLGEIADLTIETIAVIKAATLQASCYVNDYTKM
jgi:hypothetical protein